MMHLRRIAPATWAIFSLFIISESAFANGNSEEAKARHFGLGQPKNVHDLPNGKLRKNLEKLSPSAKGKALGWLQRFEFPVEDVISLRVNARGDISYVDAFIAGEGGEPEAQQFVESHAVDPDQVFLLHSNPGANNVVFLDFDGHTLEGTAWSDVTLVALPFDPSGNDNPATEANFSAEELNTIAEIWHRVSEDFAAFNIDVTTEEPAVFTSTTGRVLFTHHTDASGFDMPSPTAGGIAYVNVFGRTDYASRYSPALVYYTNLAERSVGLWNYNAEVASHEFGHNLGLSHDGDYNGNTYYPGHGTDLVSWGPIMGMMLDKNVTQWSKGEYPSANNQEDDLAIIAGDLGYIGDDHGDSANQATALVVEENGDILASSPEFDPDNVLSENKGVIDGRNDSDWFYLDIDDAGSLSLTATPAWHSFTRNDSRGANLDIELALFDSNLDLMAIHDPDDDTNATVSATLAAGRYYVQVDGVGNNTLSDYTDYGSMGMYFLEGYVSAEITQPEVDTKPPSPSTMSWQINPNATGESTIEMTAVEATDESGSVQYLFTCTFGGTGCVESGWQNSRSYTASGLTSGTYYEYKVTARDIHDNQTLASNSVGVTTQSPPPQVENIAPEAIATYSSELAIITKGKTASVTLDGSASFDQDGRIVDWSWTDSQGNSVGSGEQITPKLREGSHQFTLTVTDNEGATGTTDLTVTVAKKDDSGKGKPPPKK